MTSVRDIILVAVVLFAVAISILVTVNISHKTLSNIHANPIFNNTPQAALALDKGDASLDYTDYVYFSAFLGIFLAIIIFGYLVGGLEVFSVIYFFLLIIFVVISYILQESWKTLVNSSDFVITAAALPLTNFIVSNLALMICIMGLVGLLAMYAKPQMQNG
jgi:hypothetical protein